MADIRTRYEKLFKEHTGAEPKPDVCLYDQNLDSLDVVELTMAVEGEFNMEIPDDDVYCDAHTLRGNAALKLNTPDDWVKYLEGRTNATR